MRTCFLLALTFATARTLTLAQDAPKTADVPVQQVVLFSSGVGYFEHGGTVHGAATTELRFKTAQINDILKSLVLQDEGGGSIGAVTYPSQDPLEKTLGSFAVDVSGNPPLADLLNQLRGGRVSVKFQTETLDGTLLGVEEKQKSIGSGDTPAVVKTHVLNLIEGGAIRAIPLEEITSIKLEDAGLQAELEKALAALAQARDQEKKAVTIRFDGTGDRHVRIGYVIETPIWKTSYRLVLGDDKSAGTKMGGASKLQGWAIVENQTDSDWKEVSLSLISGRPISFIQNLYQPLYIQRPVVQPELYSSLRPQTYSGGIAAQDAEGLAAAAMPANAPMESAKSDRHGAHSKNLSFGLGSDARAREQAGQFPAGAADGGEENGFHLFEKRKLMDVAASVASAASAANLGELFQYAIPAVTLARQRSAMLPILNDPVRAERLSIYNRGVLATHPLNGVRLTNTTGKHLLQGPITVFAENSYAGDARIEDTPPGQSRLLSYGIDLPMTVNADKNKQEDAVQNARIVKGALELQRKLVASQEYAVENKSDESRALVIEHPFRAGWKLVNTAQPVETTETLYRFQTNVAAKKATVFTVNEESVSTETVAILPVDFGQLEIYSSTGKIPAGVKAALEKAIVMKRAMSETQTQISARQTQVEQIGKEQTRIRENMKTVGQNGDYSNRLLKKLNDQETRIEALQKEAEELQGKLETQRRDLEAYLGDLNVG